MSSVFDQLYSRGLLRTPPVFLKNNIHYEVMTGSIAYGCNTDYSDIDVYGFGIPAKDLIFPHSAGYIPGFDTNTPKFNQFSQHHIKDKEANREYDISIYNIVNFFKLTMECNPNMVDVLFVPRNCVLFSTEIGEHVRSNRRLFLHKGAFHKFRGYAASQLHKMKSKKIKEFIKICNALQLSYDVTIEELNHVMETGTATMNKTDVAVVVNLIKQVDKDGKRTNRINSIAKHGFDVKFGYHLVRLVNECQQILEMGDLDIQRDREIYKAIRRGDWTEDQVVDYFGRHDNSLKDLYDNSKLAHSPNVNKIRSLLLECLEMHFGSLDKVVQSMDRYEMAIRDIKTIVDKL